MDSSLILRATLFGMILLGLLIPAQTEAGYLGSVKKEYSQGIKRLRYLGSSSQGMKKQVYLGSVKSEYNNQGMKKQAALEGKDHLVEEKRRTWIPW